MDSRLSNDTKLLTTQIQGQHAAAKEELRDTVQRRHNFQKDFKKGMIGSTAIVAVSAALVAAQRFAISHFNVGPNDLLFVASGLNLFMGFAGALTAASLGFLKAADLATRKSELHHVKNLRENVTTARRMNRVLAYNNG